MDMEDDGTELVVQADSVVKVLHTYIGRQWVRTRVGFHENTTPIPPRTHRFSEALMYEDFGIGYLTRCDEDLAFVH